MQEVGYIMCNYWCIWSDGKTVHFEIFDLKMYFIDASDLRCKCMWDGRGRKRKYLFECQFHIVDSSLKIFLCECVARCFCVEYSWLAECRWQCICICIFLNVFVICICDEYGWLAGCTWQCREEGNGFLSVPLMDLWPLSSSLLFIIARCCFVFKMYLLPRCRMYFSPQKLFGVLLILHVFSVIHTLIYILFIANWSHHSCWVSVNIRFNQDPHSQFVQNIHFHILWKK